MTEAPEIPRFETHKEFEEWADALSKTEKAVIKARALDDWMYFFRNFVWINMKPDRETKALYKKSGRVPPRGWRRPVWWPVQLVIAQIILIWRLLLLIKIRQMGASWIAISFLVWLALHDHQNIAMLSVEGDRADDLFARFMGIWSRVPSWMRPALTGKPSGNYLETQNGTRVKSMKTTKRGTISDAYTAVFVDEAHVIEDERRIDLTDLAEVGVHESLRDSEGYGIFFTTSRGPFGWVYKKAKRLHPGLGGKQKSEPESWFDWHCHFVGLRDHPDWTPEMAQKAMAEAEDPEKWKREHPEDIKEAFAASGKTVFNPHALRRMEKTILDGQDESGRKIPKARYVTFSSASPERGFLPILSTEAKETTRLYRVPVRDHKYAIGADTTHGASSDDWCAGVVLDIDTGEVVAVIHHKFNDPFEFGRYLQAVGYYYNTAQLAPEINVDRGLVKCLMIDQYPNLYRRSLDDETGAEFDTIGEKVGWRTNPGMQSGSRTKMLSVLKREVVGTWLKIYDYPLLREMFSFTSQRRRTGAPEREEAAPGAHDDMLMSLGIVVYVATEEPEKIEDGANSSEDLEGSWGASMRMNRPVRDSDADLYAKTYNLRPCGDDDEMDIEGVVSRKRPGQDIEGRHDLTSWI